MYHILRGYVCAQRRGGAWCSDFFFFLLLFLLSFHIQTFPPPKFRARPPILPVFLSRPNGPPLNSPSPWSSLFRQRGSTLGPGVRSDACIIIWMFLVRYSG